MGQDKSFLRLRGRPLIEHTLDQVADLGVETFIVTNSPEAYHPLGFPLVMDVLPGHGPLGGLYTALYSAAQPQVLCLACDMPFFVKALRDYLLGLIPEGEVIMPRLGDRPEPFRAIYGRPCLDPIRAALANGRWRVSDFLPAMRVRFVDEPEIDRFDSDHRSFFNLNMPADLERAAQLF